TRSKRDWSSDVCSSDLDLVVLCSCDHKVGQFVSPFFQIFQIEHALGQTPKESRHPILQDFAARAKQRRARIELASERDQIAFVPSSAMQKQQCAIGGAGNEFVNE